MSSSDILRLYCACEFLLSILKSEKLCEARGHKRGFYLRPHLASGNTAIHKRKLHIMAVMHSYA